VEEVFRNSPDATRVFIKYHTDCVGCRLARFCTLEEVAKVYELDLDFFLNELRTRARPPSKSKEVKHENL
jgi:hybrid cluster-associated redox disulfide protein